MIARSWWRNKVFFLVSVVSLALGLACTNLLATYFVHEQGVEAGNVVREDIVHLYRYAPRVHGSQCQGVFTLPPLDVLCLDRLAADGFWSVRHRLVCHPPADTRNQCPQSAWRHIPPDSLAACQAFLPVCPCGVHSGYARYVGTDAELAATVRLSGGVGSGSVCLALRGRGGCCPDYGLLAGGSVRAGQSGRNFDNGQLMPDTGELFPLARTDRKM